MDANANVEQKNIATLENGQVLEFVDGEMRLGERVPSSYVFVDGTGVGDVDRSVMREREMLSQDGIVLLNLVKDKSNLKEVEIISRGFMSPAESQDLFEDLRKRIEKLARSANGNLERDVLNLAKSHIFDETKRRPVVFVNISKA